MKNLKLKWKITFYFLIFSVVLLLVLWFFQTVLLEEMYINMRKKEIERAIQQVEENIEGDDLLNIIRILEIEKNIYVTPSHEYEPFLQNVLNGKRNVKGRKILIVTEREEFKLSNGETVSFTFYAMITPVQSTVETLQYQLYYITFIMIVLSIVISIVISRRIAKPIEEINSSAKFLSSGEYDVNFNGKGFLEISELSETLNVTTVELSKIDNLRRELIANVSHDLRTPLSLIYSYAEIMNDFPNEITPEKTQIIMDETKRLTSIVNDLLNMSQLNSNAIELKKEKFNITKEIKDTITRTEELVKNKKYEIQFDYNDEVYVHADKIKIMQAFYNLLINAINYTGDDCKVVVKQELIDDSVRIEVVDSGDGVDKEMLPYIWDRYFKSDKNHKRGVTGTGIGLSIVKNIIQLHEGKYGVISNKNEHTTFWFEIKL